MAGRKVTVSDRARAVKKALVAMRGRGLHITQGQAKTIKSNMATCGGCRHRVGNHNIYEGTPYVFRCNVLSCKCRLDTRIGG